MARAGCLCVGVLYVFKLLYSRASYTIYIVVLQNFVITSSCTLTSFIPSSCTPDTLRCTPELRLQSISFQLVACFQPFLMSTTIWSDESGNEDRLLDLIEERRALYDIADSSYSNKVVKSRLWREISAELNIEGMRFCLLLLLYSTCAMQCCYEPPPLCHNILYICTRNYYQRPTLLFTLIWSTELSFCSFLRHCNGLYHTGLPIQHIGQLEKLRLTDRLGYVLCSVAMSRHHHHYITVICKYAHKITVRPTLLFTLIWSTELSCSFFLLHCNGLHYTCLPISLFCQTQLFLLTMASWNSYV